jgi:hypothetical protein
MNRLRHSFLLSILVLLIFACSEKQDFTQYDDLSITPTLETSIFFVKVQESIINRVVDVSFFTQDFNFDAFEEAFFSERVLEGVITYELENTTDKPIEIEIQFLGENDALLDTELFTMPAAPTAVFIREVAYGNTGKSLDILRNTTNLRLNAVNFGDNSSTSGIPGASIVLRSSAQFMLRLK